jgi:DNA polymerase-3 subunit beta
VTPKTAPPSFRLDAGDLHSAAAWAVRAVPARTTQPILSGFLIEPAEDGITLTAYDYETQVRALVHTDGDPLAEPVVVHGRLLADAAAHLTGPVTVTIDGAFMVLTTTRQRFRLAVMPVDMYPNRPPLPETSGQIDADVLATMATRAAVTAINDPATGTVCHTAHLRATDGSLVIRSTDKYRATRVEALWDGRDLAHDRNGTVGDILIPAAPLVATVRGMSGPVALGADASLLAIVGRDRAATILLAAGDPLPIQRIYDETTAGSVTVVRAELVEAVAANRVAIDRGKPLALDVDTEAGTVSVAGAGDRADAGAELEATGDLTVRWSVNPEYLSDLIAALSGDHITLTANARKPELLGITLTDDAPGAPATSFVLVPLRPAGGSR